MGGRRGGGASPRLSGSLRLCGPGSRNQTEEKGLAQLSFIQLMSAVFVPLLLFSPPDAVRAAVETDHSRLLVPSQRIPHRTSKTDFGVFGRNFTPPNKLWASQGRDPSFWPAVQICAEAAAAAWAARSKRAALPCRSRRPRWRQHPGTEHPGVGGGGRATGAALSAFQGCSRRACQFIST